MFLSVAIAFLASVSLTPLAAGWARRRGFLDVPNERSSHVVATPRTGGAAFVLALLTGVVVCHYVGDGLVRNALIVVSLASGVAVLGLADDFTPLPASLRLLIQTALSVLLIWLLGAEPFSSSIPSWIGFAVTVFWIVALTNAYNFMDGIDGIAGGQALVAGFGWAAIGAVIGSKDLFTLGSLVAAATAGFLIYNWPPARVFMGDAGSAFLGFFFGAVPLVVLERGWQVVIWAALLVWPFLFDTGFTLVRRLRRRENIFTAHRSHLYQRLTITGLPHSHVTILYCLLGVVGAGASIALAAVRPGTPLITAAALTASAIGLWRYVVSRESMARVQL